MSTVITIVLHAMAVYGLVKISFMFGRVAGMFEAHGLVDKWIREEMSEGS